MLLLIMDICNLDGGRFRFRENSNTVLFLSKGINEKHVKHDLKTYKNMFDQSLLCTCTEVKKVIGHLKRLYTKNQSNFQKSFNVSRKDC